MRLESPRLLVLSSLFPSDGQPGAGIFIRERMFRVGKHVPIVVLAPQAWFPCQGLVRLIQPHFRPSAPRFQLMTGVEVHRPRYLSFPGLLKRADGVSMALSSLLTARRLVRKHRLNVLDAHFAYPDGRAAAFLKQRLGLPMVLTLRGKENREARGPLRKELEIAVRSADQVIAVSDALREVAIELGADASRVTMVGNGIDIEKFRPIAREEARARLGLPSGVPIIITVGTLVERKGCGRIIEALPDVLRRHPNLRFLVIGGAGAEGDHSAQFRASVASLGLNEHVRFYGPMPPERLHELLSAADVFVLASSYEGWANVLLEAMACGLPVVATDVGGNGQVVCQPELGRLVPFGDVAALASAIGDALDHPWDRKAILQYARDNAWDTRIPVLVEIFKRVLATTNGKATADESVAERGGRAG